jgi:hypothetical protein
MPSIELNFEAATMDDEADLKRDINAFVWSTAPGAMTLEKADDLACQIFELFLDARRDCPA